MTNTDVVLVGRSSSHYTRTARIFALELGVPCGFRAVLDMTSMDPAAYAGNPALKIPILVDTQGSLFGTENICRELARRSALRDGIVLRGQVGARVVANAEELILAAMGAEVSLIMAGQTSTSTATSPKVRRSLENALAFLETNLDPLQAALPAERRLSFCETTLFCLVTHLPFRQVMSVDAYPRLQAFCQSFAERPAAQATTYHFDAA